MTQRIKKFRLIFLSDRFRNMQDNQSINQEKIRLQIAHITNQVHFIKLFINMRTQQKWNMLISNYGSQFISL